MCARVSLCRVPRYIYRGNARGKSGAFNFKSLGITEVLRERKRLGGALVHGFGARGIDSPGTL